jgi:hypothetical protein
MVEGAELVSANCKHIHREGKLMVADPRKTFHVSFITSEAPAPIQSASELLTGLRSRPVWDGASISPTDAQFPLVHLDWHEGQGFVLQCYEDEESPSYFLVSSRDFSRPSIEVELGGQALERWPGELFASSERAARALNHFLEFGRQDPALEWVRIDAFPRETVWEGREERESWERANRTRDTGAPSVGLRNPGGYRRLVE